MLFEIAVLFLLASSLAVTISIYRVLNIMVENQKKTHDQAKHDVDATANALQHADQARQTHDDDTGHDTVNVTSR